MLEVRYGGFQIFLGDVDSSAVEIDRIQIRIEVASLIQIGQCRFDLGQRGIRDAPRQVTDSFVRPSGDTRGIASDRRFRLTTQEMRECHLM